MDESGSPQQPRSVVPAAAVALILGLAGGFAGGRLLPPRDAMPEGAASTESPRDGSAILARVGDDVLTKAELDERWRQLDPSDRSFHGERAREEGGGSARAHFLDELVDEMLLAREARRRGLESRPDVSVALRACARRVVARPLLAQEVREHAVPEAEIASWYAAHPDHFGVPARVRVREIVVTSSVSGPGDATPDAASARAKAEELRARASAGEDFGKLAASASEAPSARYDGLVGWVVDGRLSRPWEATALQLQVGQTSDILEIPEGFAILHADEREETTIRPLAEVRDEVLEQLLADDQGALQRRYNVFLRQLRDAETVEVHPELLGQDAPTEPAASSGTPDASPGGASAPGG